MPESGVNTQLTIERRLASLRRRLVRESTLAIEMLERSLDALQRMDVELAREVRRSDDRGAFVLLSAAMPSRLLTAFPPGTPIDRVTLDEAVVRISELLGQVAILPQRQDVRTG